MATSIGDKNLITGDVIINEDNKLPVLQLKLNAENVLVSIAIPGHGFVPQGRSWLEKEKAFFQKELEVGDYLIRFEKAGLPAVEHKIHLPEMGCYAEVDYPSAHLSRRIGEFPHRLLLHLPNSTKVFLVASELVGFGRGIKSDNDQIEISLAKLPIKSEKEDKEHFLRNLSIGTVHGLIQMYEERVILKLLSQMQTHRLDEARQVLEALEHKHCYKLDDQAYFLFGSDALQLGFITYRVHGKVACVKVERERDAHHISYVLIRQGAYLGSGPQSAISLPKLCECSLSFSYDCEAKSFRVGVIDDSFQVLVGERTLKLHESSLITPGERVEVGPYCIECAPVADVDFFVP
jgi:hypothetical protein